jgi:hypothetical protein
MDQDPAGETRREFIRQTALTTAVIPMVTLP